MVDDAAVKEIQIEGRIEEMVRVIHQNVLDFYIHYRTLNSIIQESDDIQKAIQHLRIAHSKLVTIKDIAISGLNTFREKEERLGHHLANNRNKKLYDTAVMDMLEIVKDLEGYTISLGRIISIAESKGIDEKTFKANMQSTFDALSQKYEKFLMMGKDLTKALKSIQ